MKYLNNFIKFKQIKNQLMNFFHKFKIFLFHFSKKQYSLLKPYCSNLFHKIFKGKEEYVYLFFKTYKNYIYPVLGGISITLGLFYIMTILISEKTNLSSLDTDNISISFLSSKEVEELKTKDRRFPEKPKESQTPPTTPKTHAQQNKLEKPKISIPRQSLNLPKDFAKKDKFSIFENNSLDTHGNSEVTPIVRIEPNYPRKAATLGLEGFVILQFDITSSGTVTNISILQASPPQIFNRSATRALQKWKYKPKTTNNKPVMQKGLKVQLDFKLEKE